MNLKRLLNISLFLFLYSFTNNLFAQTSQWVWQSTGSAPNSEGSEYTAAPNIPSTAYLPATRENAAVSSDAAGNLWLYGGGQVSPWSKLWKFNTTTKEWTWLTGSSSDSAPSGRNSATSWIDNNGNFWLFGGSSGPILPSHNDLWKFDIAANKWIQLTTETGFGEGVYGTQGIPSPDNHPGRRFGSVGWKDKDGNLWLFGGYGYGLLTASYSIGALNDLWKYNIATNQWTWVGGNIYTGDRGSYGSKGFPSPDNVPGARYGATAQADGKGMIWMYGSSSLNDLWKYDIAANVWTWMAGDTTVSSDGNKGVYGDKGVAAVVNTPGYRYGMCSFIDSAGNFWMFGGRTLRYNNINPYIGYFNDLWRFDTRSNQWAWIDGDSITDAERVYANGAGSDPGGREGMAAWTDNKSQFWMFGGFTSSADGSFAYMNDLWVYTSSSVLPVTLLSFTGQVVNQSALLNWKVAQAVNNKGFEIQKSKDGRTFSDIGFVANINSDTYTFTDVNLSAGTSLYRLKQIDINGKFSYSPVVNLNYSFFKWNIINSSANTNAYLQLQLDKASSVSVQVVTVNGTTIQSINKEHLEAGSYTIPLDIRQASSGLFIVRLIVNEKYYTKKLIIKR